MKTVRFLTLLALSITLTGLVACSKESSALWKNGGEWKVLSLDVLELDEDGEEEFHIEIQNPGTITFAKDETYVMESSFLGETDVEKGTYEYANDKLTLTPDEDDKVVFDVVRTGDKMTLISDEVHEDGSRSINTLELERN